MQTAATALVLRRVKLGEADQILTLLTHDRGIISASARGSLRLKNKLFSGCGLFCYSEFTLTPGRSTWFVEDAQVRQSFYGLSESVEGMALAMYLSDFIAALEPDPQEADAQLRLLLNCLYLIANHRGSPAQIKAVCELRGMAQAGYMPDLLCCRECGAYDGPDFYFHAADGSLLCGSCARKAGRKPNLDGGALTALRHICLVEDKKVFSFALAPHSLALLNAVAEQYTREHLDKPLKTLDFLKSL